ncbi:hypothetical protein BASA50_004193 [Batrachochytrium salamandrivorans]|uniref:Eukaryotic translation initiation factor 3 subunit M n=1 Tax=Batrachochytrium salamandrivorans TaxID=1357716 RepID=A0ABQ8FGB5_9FUNG|nr:hypothetical protein BASA62_009406 [Batrachochytrium salamandrivorans]KAH6568346.1 hypothetical protein BASA60_008649 [Batrachochytrium salamandrivorans]KAH6597849.1 hypothetical protein BASA50_004193 [Batrachochytrium salamandrivorans]KAH9269368.1 hypothetical protein BASA83_008594 [Batrachochytrium salamandrivorans]
MTVCKLAFIQPEQSLQLANLIADHKDKGSKEFLNSATELIETGNTLGLASLFVSEVAILLSLPDNESTLNLVIGLVCGVSDLSKLEGIVNLLLAEFEKANPEHSSTHLSILSTLYNSLDSYSHTRFGVYMTIVRVASNGGELDAILGTLSSLESWIDEWQISLSERRSLYLLLSVELGKSQELLLKAHDLLLRHLNTYQGLEKEASASDVKELASKALVQAISIPEVLNFEDVLRLTAVTALGSTKIVELSKIFLNQSLTNYNEFLTKNSKFVKEQGFSQEDNIRKMRILSLATLASEHLQGDVAYSTISKTLDVSEDEVEFWVIDAIRAGLVDAKINQLQKTIAVTRATQRTFEVEQWKLLQSRLLLWKNNLGECLEVIEKSKPQLAEAVANVAEAPAVTSA